VALVLGGAKTRVAHRPHRGHHQPRDDPALREWMPIGHRRKVAVSQLGKITCILQIVGCPRCCTACRSSGLPTYNPGVVLTETPLRPLVSMFVSARDIKTEALEIGLKGCNLWPNWGESRQTGRTRALTSRGV
jgi:hypothetical protein